MKTINELKAEKQKKVNACIDNSGMFFAFSNEQFAANKTPLQEGEKYVAWGAGAYIPKSKLPAFNEAMKEIDKWFKGAVKANKQRKANIIDELRNHEAFYTYELEDTLAALGGDYTEEEVKKVFWEEEKNHA